MPKKNTKKNLPSHFTNTHLELVNWPLNFSLSLANKVLAIQTTRLSPVQNSEEKTEDNIFNNEKFTFGGFNLGLHVGDNEETVIKNRNTLKNLIRELSSSKSNTLGTKEVSHVEIQWLEQVHGNYVTTVWTVKESPVTADACITRKKNIALAIMTADCLPILLTHKDGTEIAAIHGGWRPLASNIIEKTLNKMHSKSAEVIAWLGPCIGHKAFEVGNEVKAAFIQQNPAFEVAFIEQENGKHLADLHKIARLQLEDIGVSVIGNLAECTLSNTDKYYSYRKDNITGRMASVICRQ